MDFEVIEPAQRHHAGHPEPEPGEHEAGKARKHFYIDEDSWAVLAYEGWDHSDKLSRLLFTDGVCDYANGGFFMLESVQAYDLARGQYAFMQAHLCDNCYDRRGLPFVPDHKMTPGQLGGRGIR